MKEKTTISKLTMELSEILSRDIQKFLAFKFGDSSEITIDRDLTYICNAIALVLSFYSSAYVDTYEDYFDKNEKHSLLGKLLDKVNESSIDILNNLIKREKK